MYKRYTFVSNIGLIDKYSTELNQLMTKAMAIEGEAGIPF